MNRFTGRRILRLFFIFCASLFMLCFPRFAGAADVLRISLPDAVRLEGNACSLSEVAEIDGPRALTERAGELLLMAENGVITREQVIAALRSSGLANVRIELKMPESVIVERGSAGREEITIPGSPFQEEEFREEEQGQADLPSLIKSLAAWDGEVEVQHRGKVPDGRLVSPASIVPGTGAATLRFRGASGRDRSLAVRLIWTQQALILTRSLEKGDIISESDVTARQVRVNKPGVYASKISEAAGRSIRRNLSQGEPLPLNLLTDVPIIERGKGVTIIVRSGSLVVTAKGEAMESGALDDVVRVRNTASKAVLSAVVVADDTVEVRIP